VCGQLTEDGWRECCEIFRHNPARKSRAHTFPLAGLRPGIELYNYQAYAIYWMALRLLIPIAPGCILADEMGLGKTVEILGLICLLRDLSLAWDDVLACWNAHSEPRSKKHLLQNTSGYQQPAGSRCPSQRSGQNGISCPCVIGSLSHRLAKELRPGPWLILVPPKNISVWVKECKKMLNLDDIRMKLEYMVAHDKSDLTSQQVTALRNDAETQQGRKEQGRLIVISSPQSLYARVVGRALRFKQISSRRQQTKWEVDHPISWGGMVHDECHEAKNRKTVPNVYFQKARNFHPRNKNPQTGTGRKRKRGAHPEFDHPEGQVTSHPSNPLRIGVSGTPIEGSPDDIIGIVLSWADMPKWALSGSGFEHCTTSNLQELTRLYKQVVNEVQGGPQTKEIKAKIRNYVAQSTTVMTSIMIKRRAVDDFFGEPIVDIPAMNILRHGCPLKPECYKYVARLAADARKEALKTHEAQMLAWGRGGKQGDPPIMGSAEQQKSKHAFYLRLCAGFPAIARLRETEPGWKFTGTELYHSIGMEALVQGSLYKMHIKTLVESSAKIPQLEAILTDLARRSEANKKQGKKRAKALILTHSPALLAILVLYFQEYRQSKTRFVTIATPMGFEARTRVIDGFCNRRDEQGRSVHPMQQKQMCCSASSPSCALVTTCKMPQIQWSCLILTG
jgi:hypothetical protein